MNSRERVAVAMAKKTPDRVPVMCQLALGHYFLNTDQPFVDIWHDSEAFAQALVQLQRRYGFDGILINLPGRDPDWRKNIVKTEDVGGETIIHWKNGMFTVAPPDDNPHVYIEPEVRNFPTFEEVDPEKLFYMEPHDLSAITYPYSWGFSNEPAPVGGEDFFPPWECNTIKRVRELTKGEVAVHAEFFSPFSQFMEMLDYTNGLMALMDDAGKCHAMLDRLSDGAATLGRLHARAGADALLISSAFTGAGLISRAHYEEFELPYMKKVISGIKSEFPDVPIYVHTCGAIGDRLDLMEQTGVDGIDTFDPPPLGTVELKDAVQTLGKRVFIKGNLDPVNTLLMGTPDDVMAASRERIETAGPGGAYILSTACSVAPAAPPENVAKLREAVETYGKY
ncbi:MAG: uroporphyrinogen decarboxylase family protein [Candidatus Sumerlaeaceae bacterium]|nr:uroporphyrinogen decarboxylase family protein [Candidatus Sumerlaeaceae bacterium]